MSDAEWVSLCFVADITMGQSPDSIFVNNQEVGLPFLQGCAEFGARHPLPKVYCSPPLRIAKNNSILISVRAPVGTTNFSDQDYCIGRGLAAIKAKSGIAETMYLKYAIESNISFLHRRSQGSTFLAIGSADLNAFKIPNLHINEQQKISRILTSIDTAIEKTESLIAKYQKIKAGLMHDLFTRGVTADGKLRPPREQAPELYQETAIGWIPKEWRVDCIESVLNRIIDYRGKTPEKTVAGIPLITAKNVRIGYIDSEPKEFIAETDYSRWMTRGIPNVGDILFTTEAPLGNVAQIQSHDRVAFAQRVIILQPSHQIRATFLAYLLMSTTTQNAIGRLASGSTALGIKQSEFRKVLIGFPTDKNEQQRIESNLEAMNEFLFKQLESKKKLQWKKHGLMHDLLTGKVPVKIDESDKEFA